MNRNGARTRVRNARAELEKAEQQLATRYPPWRERLGRHRLSLLVGGGLLGGFALATVSPKRWSRVGAVLFGGSAWLIHSPVGPALLGALWTNILGASDVSRSHAADVAVATLPASK